MFKSRPYLKNLVTKLPISKQEQSPFQCEVTWGHAKQFPQNICTETHGTQFSQNTFEFSPLVRSMMACWPYHMHWGEGHDLEFEI